MLASPGLFCHTQSGHPQRARQWGGARHERLADEPSPSWQRPLPGVDAAVVRVECLPWFSRFFCFSRELTGILAVCFSRNPPYSTGTDLPPSLGLCKAVFAEYHNIPNSRTTLRPVLSGELEPSIKKGVIHGPIRLITWRMFYRWHACCRAFNVTTPAAPRRCPRLSPRRRLRLHPRHVGLLTIAFDQHELAGEVRTEQHARTASAVQVPSPRRSTS